MEPKVILSLFDFSGAWTQPYPDAGHEVILIDAKHEPELHDISRFTVAYLLETLGIEWVTELSPRRFVPTSQLQAHNTGPPKTLTAARRPPCIWCAKRSGVWSTSNRTFG